MSEFFCYEDGNRRSGAKTPGKTAREAAVAWYEQRAFKETFLPLSTVRVIVIVPEGNVEPGISTWKDAEDSFCRFDVRAIQVRGYATSPDAT